MTHNSTDIQLKDITTLKQVQAYINQETTKAGDTADIAKIAHTAVIQYRMQKVRKIKRGFADYNAKVLLARIEGRQYCE